MQIILAMLKLREADMRAIAGQEGEGASAELFNLLARLPQTCNDADILFDVLARVATGVSDTLVATLRSVKITSEE